MLNSKNYVIVEVDKTNNSEMIPKTIISGLAKNTCENINNGDKIFFNKNNIVTMDSYKLIHIDNILFYESNSKNQVNLLESN